MNKIEFTEKCKLYHLGRTFKDEAVELKAAIDQLENDKLRFTTAAFDSEIEEKYDTLWGILFKEYLWDREIKKLIRLDLNVPPDYLLNEQQLKDGIRKLQNSSDALGYLNSEQYRLLCALSTVHPT